MKIKVLIFISILFVTSFPANPAKSEFLKLEKAAVSSIPEELVIPDLKSVTIDPKGNVFAFAGKPNGKECFIVKFNEHLEYLKHFGREGKGPGEFTTKAGSPQKRISLDANGDVYVVDYNPRRLVIFDNEGKYKEDILIARDYSKLVGSVYDIKAVGNRTFIALQYRDNLPTMGLIFTLNPPEVKVRHSFNEKDIRFNYVSYAGSYYGENCIIDTDSKHIVFGNSQMFKFHVFDMNGNLKVVKEDENRPMKRFSNKEMEYIIRDQFTPKVGDSPYRKTYLSQLKSDRPLYNKILNAIKKSKNVIADIKIAGEKVYVFTVCDDVSVENKCPVEVYNLKGELIKKGYFKEIPAGIWKNNAFFYSRDTETDDPLILKYKILDN